MVPEAREDSFSSKGHIYIGSFGFVPEMQLGNTWQGGTIYRILDIHASLQSWFPPPPPLLSPPCGFFSHVLVVLMTAPYFGGPGGVVFKRQKSLLIKITIEKPLNLTEAVGSKHSGKEKKWSLEIG